VAGTGDPAHPWDGSDADGAIVLGEVLQKEGDQIVRWRGRTSLPAIRAARGLSVTLLIGEKHVPAGGLGRAEAGDASVYDGQNPASCSRVAGPGHGLAASAADPFNNNFGSAHSGVCQFLYADGSVRPIAVGIDETVLGELARRGQP
jgi:prepilin-type processing-associated H-X9-DG protein